MSNYLISRAEIIDAITRVHDFDTHPVPDRYELRPEDGTYKLYATWIGSARVWMAQRVTQESGFEVAIGAIPESAYYELGSARFGIWTDPATGEIDLDQTVNIRGSLNAALDLGEHYNQKAIWDWSEGKVVEV